MSSQRPELERTVRMVRNLGWHTVVLGLHDPVTQSIHPAAISTADPVLETALQSASASQSDLWRQDRFRISRSYFVERRALPEICLLQDGVFPDHDVVIVPLEVDDQGFGWLAVQNPSDPGRPDDSAVHALEFFADHVVLMLQHTRLFQQVREQRSRQTLLNEITYAISQHLDITTLFSVVTRELRRMMAFERASITLREGTKTLTQDGDSEKTPLEAIAVSHIIKGKSSNRIISDLSTFCELDAEKQLVAAGIRSYACLPLLVWGQVIGAFSLSSRTPDTFRPQEADYLLQIADHIAGAVWNTLLYDMEQKRRRTADALAQLAQIVNSTLELDNVLELALEQVERVIAYDSAAILLSDGPHLRIMAGRGFAQPDTLIGSVIAMEENNIGHQAIRLQKAIVVPDVQQIQNWGHARDDIEGAHTIRAWIGAPLVVRDQSIGILTLNHFEPGFYTDEDGEAVAAFAAQIATAIQNARLYQVTQQQRDRLTAILTDTTDGIIVLNQAQEIWLINPAAERYLKVNRQDVSGRLIDALNVPELTKTLAAAQQTPVVLEIAGPNNTSLNASLAPVHEVGWVIVMQDITHLKELDYLRTEWVAAVSHDLKNPIQVVQLGAALLEMDGPLNPAQMDRVELIQRSAKHLSELVTDVLDLARLEAGPTLRFAPISMRDVVESALSEVEHLALEKHQPIHRLFGPDSPVIRGDMMLLKQAVGNLLGNAIKYTAPGGTITVQMAVVDRSVHLGVTDTGQGIPSRFLPHLFERFYRVPEISGEGTGLGLSIVKSIVEKHNGRIAVTSDYGKGSTFTLVLPML